MTSGQAYKPRPYVVVEGWKMNNPWHVFHGHPLEWKLRAVFDRFRRYCYHVNFYPIDGREEAYYQTLRCALRVLEAEADWLRKQWGFRGESKNLVTRLHSSMPVAHDTRGISVAEAQKWMVKERWKR